MIKTFLKAFSLFAVSSLLFTSCKKYDDNLTVAPTLARFASNSASYFVTNSSTSQYKLPVSLTAVRTEATTVTITASSPTGAASGVQYTIPATSITIPAGKLSDTLRINGIFAGYPGNRRDTLILTISTSTAGIMEDNSRFTLIMSKACDVVFSQLAGNYTRTNEFSGGAFSYGPYTTSVGNFTATGLTTARCSITNIYDDGWNPILVDIDYTNPAAYTLSIPLQPTGRSYSGAPTSVRTTPGRVNTFSSCDQTFSFFIDLVNGTTAIQTAYEIRMVR